MVSFCLFPRTRIMMNKLDNGILSSNRIEVEAQLRNMHYNKILTLAEVIFSLLDNLFIAALDVEGQFAAT